MSSLNRKMRKNLVGRRFGRLVVTSESKPKSYRSGKIRRWVCRCDCGEVKIVFQMSLTGKITRSCGCWNLQKKTTHGESSRKHRAPEYDVWVGMRRRCRDDEVYRSRGVCALWNRSYSAFLKDVGRRPSPCHTIERIDNSRGYEPKNVRWATYKDQGRNKKTNRVVEVGGVKLCVSAWSERTGLCKATITSRLNHGWSARDAVSRAPQKGKRP